MQVQKRELTFATISHILHSSYVGNVTTTILTQMLIWSQQLLSLLFNVCIHNVCNGIDERTHTRTHGLMNERTD